MLTNVTERRPVEVVSHAIEFLNDEGCGFSFDCDAQGTPVLETLEAKANYSYALSHPEMFTDKFNEFTTRRRVYIEPAHGTCSCGTQVELINQYQGACSCSKCGKWYNLYGQELLPPECWEE